MATVSPSSEPSLDIREQIARIDKMQAELGKVQVEITKITVDTDKTRLDVRLAPWTAAFTGLGAGAAVFAAGAAFAKLLLS
jgi:tetrahydromethanopterin S-methyltransferase subunit D